MYPVCRMHLISGRISRGNPKRKLNKENEEKEGKIMTQGLLCQNLEKHVLSTAKWSYESIKERLIIRPINYTDHQHELKDIVCKVCGDIALVLYAILYDDAIGLGTTKVNKECLEIWKKGIEEVFEDAMNNTYLKALPRLYLNPLDANNPTYKKGAFMSANSKITKIGEMQAPMVTTTRQINGAIVMFYPEVKERLAELFDGSFYIAFTSIHEARIHRVGSVTPRMILRTLNEVNSIFPGNEVLSRKVYLYDAESKRMEPLML